MQPATRTELVKTWRELLGLLAHQESVMSEMIMSPRSDVTDEHLLAAVHSYRNSLKSVREAAPRVYDKLAGRLSPTILRTLFPQKISTHIK